MLHDNDNGPPGEACRVLEIRGRVGPDGRVVLARPLAAEITRPMPTPRPGDPGVA